MSRRVALPVAAFAALWLGVACLDISSPVAGIAAISPIIAPTPSVVVTQDSKDTNGDVKPLRVYAFAPNGDTIRDARVVFLAVDTTHKLRVDSGTGIAHGDSLSPNAHVVARVMPANGGGALQTPSLALPVIPIPRSVSRDSNITLFGFTSSTDSLAAGLQSPPISVTLHGGPDTVIQKYIVSFELVERPPSRTSEPSVVLVNDNGRASAVDTTDAGGHASRRLRVRTSAIETEVIVGTKTVNARVRAHVRYNKDNLPGSPIEFVIPIRGQLK